jgi:hypothetical protein
VGLTRSEGVVELGERMGLEVEDRVMEGDDEEKLEKATGDDDGRIETIDDSTEPLGLELTKDTRLEAGEETDCLPN